MEDTIDRLRRIKDQLSSDLERLLNNQDVLGTIRQQLQRVVSHEQKLDQKQPEPIAFTK